MSLLELPQSSFESGDKTLPSLLAYRATKVLGRVLDPIGPINTVSTLFLPNEVKALKERIESADSPTRAEQLLQRNMLYTPGGVFLRASRFHLDNWLRDSFIACLAFNDSELEMHLLSQFVQTDYRHPQLPTTRLFAGNRAWYFDDESTMLGLIWRAKLAPEEPVRTQERQQWQERFNWIRKHAYGGFYMSSAGPEKSWLDTFLFKEKDTIAYNQGIYATTVVAAELLGLDTLPDELKDARDGYQALSRVGRLRLSLLTSAQDASALFGEYLALSLFNTNHLEPGVAKSTYNALGRDRYGNALVVSSLDGNYLSPREFNRPYQPGDYHNGADWPLFSTVARFCAEEDGLRIDSAAWEREYKNLISSKEAEYRYTGPKACEVPNYDPSRIHHAWNTLVYKLINKRLPIGLRGYR